MGSCAFVQKVVRFCPFCDKEHEVEERRAQTTVTINGVEIAYDERFYVCMNASEDDNQFMDGAMLNENMNNARRAYQAQINKNV